MTLESALKGSAISFAVFVVLFGTANTIGLRIAHAIGWTVGWLICSMIWMAIKENM